MKKYSKIIIGATLVAGVGALAYFIYKNNTGSKNDSSK